MKTVQSIPITLIRNLPPEVFGMNLLDRRGYNLGSVESVTEARGVVVQVLANDPESGVNSATLYGAVAATEEEAVFEQIGRDLTAPFQFHIEVPRRVGERMFFRASATDVDGYSSDMSNTLLSFAIDADQPPVARIVQPFTENSVIIEGQDIEVVVEANDDLGPDGIDRVVFYLNDNPLITVYENLSESSGGFAQDNLYKAVIPTPKGVEGFCSTSHCLRCIGTTGRIPVGSHWQN